MRSPRPDLHRRARRALVGLVVVGALSLFLAAAGAATPPTPARTTTTVGSMTVPRAHLATPVAADPLPDPVVTPAEADARADEILSRPEYRPPTRSVLQRVTDAVGEALGRVLQSLLGGSAGSVLAWVFLAGLLGVLGFLISRIGRSVQHDPVQTVPGVVEPRLSPSDWRADAERREASGDWKGALRCRYRALITDLVQRRVLRDIPGRTAGEYRTELRAARPAVTNKFSGASELFERAWYGDLPTGPEENRRFRELADEVVQGVGR